MSETRPPGFRRATDPAPPGVVTLRPPEPSPADALQLPLLPKPGPNAADLDALKEGAAMMTQAGNRVAALALLWSAVAIDPIDLGAHRRLAATLAHGGDFDAAAEEYARYIEFLLPLGEVGRAALELQYGASTLGGRHALHAAAEKIVAAVREIVPLTNTAIAPPPAFVPEQRAHRQAPVVAPSAPVEEAAPFAAPRLLPKVPFRFCVHADGDRHWMQLEGGTSDLVPDAVRVIDEHENVIETRLCIPLALGDQGHSPVVDVETRSVAWVVVGVPNELVAAIDAGTDWPFGFQTKVGDDWLALDLVDSGCRLGRARSSTAAS
jgi:hypothetical protein